MKKMCYLWTFLFPWNLFVLVVVIVRAKVAESEGCTADGESFSVGQQFNVPGECSENICMPSGKFIKGSCILGSPYKWKMIPEDLSKPYPQCCRRAVPPHNIVPDVIDQLPWSGFLEVTYEGVVKVDMDNLLTPRQTMNQPTVFFVSEADSLYLLAMVDADAALAEGDMGVHWLVGNVPQTDLVMGEILAGYVGPMNLKTGKLHRYVFLVYRQPGRIMFQEPRVNSTTASHRSFRVPALAEKYKLGDPMALNVFLLEHDDL